MWTSRWQSILQKAVRSSAAKYVITVAALLALFWGIMEADGANVSFVYNNF